MFGDDTNLTFEYTNIITMFSTKNEGNVKFFKGSYLTKNPLTLNF